MPVMALLRWAFLCTQWTAMGSCCSEEAFLVNVSGDIYVRALAANWPLFKRFHFILPCRREFCHSPHIQAYIELTVNGNRRLGRSLGVNRGTFQHSLGDNMSIGGIWLHSRFACATSSMRVREDTRRKLRDFSVWRPGYAVISITNGELFKISFWRRVNVGLFTFATRVLKPDCLAVQVTSLTQNHSFFINLFPSFNSQLSEWKS